ncbi:MAG TPA: hypothetical protein VGM66_05740 [Candidatus Udaeobacter sp.]|jgi:hypothetical protein
MVVLNWIQDHWFELAQTLIAIGGFFYAVRTLREDIKVKKLECGFRLTKHHREIWSEFYRRPELARVLEAKSDLIAKPVTHDERLFVTFVILHTKNAYRASCADFYLKPESLKKDIADFFSRSIPATVWSEIREFQDRDFVDFVG